MYEQFYISNCDPFVSQFFPHNCSKVKNFAGATSVIQAGLSKLMCNISYNISYNREKVKIHMSITYKLLYQVFKYHDKD